MRSESPWFSAVARVLVATLPCLLFTSAAAQAHVKWFAAYDVGSSPVGLHLVLTAPFVALALFAILLLFTTCHIERTPLGTALIDQIDDVFLGLRERTDTLIRGGIAMFFTAVWATGGIILTPELKTSSQVVLWTQALIAVCTFWRRTLPVSAACIVGLFVTGIAQYGLFHMMDYPIFLGAAAYLAMRGLGVDRLGHLRPLDVARWAVAVTLMWASVEKWAYPEWSYPVLHAHAGLTLGLSPEFYMCAAGMVEFALSFGLLWTALVRRLSTVVLLSMFISAVFEFGKIDAIGHMVIIILLAAIAADDLPDDRLRPALAPAWFSAALGATILLYYLSHTALFATPMI